MKVLYYYKSRTSGINYYNSRSKLTIDTIQSEKSNLDILVISLGNDLSYRNLDFNKKKIKKRLFTL